MQLGSWKTNFYCVNSWETNVFPKALLRLGPLLDSSKSSSAFVVLLKSFFLKLSCLSWSRLQDSRGKHSIHPFWMLGCCVLIHLCLCLYPLLNGSVTSLRGKKYFVHFCHPHCSVHRRHPQNADSFVKVICLCINSHLGQTM